jgi:uncharacterized protein YjiK
VNVLTHLLKQRGGRLGNLDRRWKPGSDLRRYFGQTLVSTTTLATIAGNASTAAYCPLTNTFATSDNGVPTCHEYFMDGTYRRGWTLSGFTDVESVCWCFGDVWAIGEEGNPGVVNDINIVRVPRDGAVSITKGGTNHIREITTGVASGANLAMEGVTFDPECGCFYFVTEKPNSGVWNVWKATWDGARITPLFDLNRPMAGKATDISDLHYDRVNRHLFLISHEGFKVFKMTLDGRIIDVIATPALFTQPEGLCFLPRLEEMLVLGEARMYGRYRRN